RAGADRRRTHPLRRRPAPHARLHHRCGRHPPAPATRPVRPAHRGPPPHPTPDRAVPVTVEVRDAATVMLVRDGAGGLEVFMLRRNLNSDFVGGAYVFPGGAVDVADRHADLEAVCEGRSDDQASQLLEIDSGGLAYWVAAIRECFEEAGVLLAYDAGGQLVSLADPDVAAR